LLYLPHCKQMHVTHFLLGLQKWNKYFRTPNDQANKMVYSFNWFEPCFSKYWPYKCVHNFYDSMRNFMKIFKFIFHQCISLCEHVGFLLRVSHIYYITYINTTPSSSINFGRQVIKLPCHCKNTNTVTMSL